MQGEVFPSIKELDGNKNSPYAKYIEDAISKVPTPQLLEKIVTSLDDLYDHLGKLPEKRNARGDLYEYMLSKLSTAGTNSLFRMPRHIIHIIVELLNLKPDDFNLRLSLRNQRAS